MTQPDPEPAPPGLSTAHASDAQITAAVLAAVDAQRGAALELLDRLVTIPSVGGSEAECEIQHVVADVLHGEGFDVDLWALDLDELRADPDFPGMEVERHEAYGVLATLPGHAPELGLSLLVDGHTDVVPPGDLDAWSGDPYDAAAGDARRSRAAARPRHLRHEGRARRGDHRGACACARPAYASRAT